MPSPIAHFAVAAAVLALLGFGRREVALGGLWAMVPDLDFITAIPWTVLAPHAPWSADTLILVEHLAGHRGLSHTFLAAVLAWGAGWAITRRARWGLIVGIGFISHILFDVITVWSIAPFWPFSTVSFRYPIVTTVDPLLTVASVLAFVALVGPLLVSRYGWALEGWGGWVRSRGKRWGRSLALASLGVVVLNAAWIGGVAVVQDVPFGDTHSAHVPKVVTLIEQEERWLVEERWSPFSEGEVRVVEKRSNQTASGDAEAAMDAVTCTLEGFGPFSLSDDPVFVARPAVEGVLVEARDMVRNATGEGPVMVFLVEEGVVVRAWTTGEPAESPWRILVPQAVVEAARCR